MSIVGNVFYCWKEQAFIVYGLAVSRAKERKERKRKP
jgi:hypothetical protein